MRWLRSVFVVALIAGLGVLVPTSPACACDCGTLPAEEALALADAAFVGTVVELDAPAGWFSSSSADPVTVTFDVSTVFKGVVPANARVQTAGDSPACGYPFRQGEQYLVHVRVEADGRWTTGLCDGNEPIALAVLPAAGYAPAPPIDYPRESPWTVLVLGAAAAVALFVVVLLVRTRRRRAAPGPS